jgi:hypothetical protein
MSIGREARRRANNRRKRIETGEITEGDLRLILESWRKEAEYRARVAFVGHPDGASRIVPAVWDLYYARLKEAKRLELVRKAIRSKNIEEARAAEDAEDFKKAKRLKEACSEIPVDEELASYCYKAIAKYCRGALQTRPLMGASN